MGGRSLQKAFITSSIELFGTILTTPLIIDLGVKLFLDVIRDDPDCSSHPRTHYRAFLRVTGSVRSPYDHPSSAKLSHKVLRAHEFFSGVLSSSESFSSEQSSSNEQSSSTNSFSVQMSFHHACSTFLYNEQSSSRSSPLAASSSSIYGELLQCDVPAPSPHKRFQTWLSIYSSVLCEILRFRVGELFLH